MVKDKRASGKRITARGALWRMIENIEQFLNRMVVKMKTKGMTKEIEREFLDYNDYNSEGGNK